MFQLNEVSDGQALRYVGFELMQKFSILSKFKVCIIIKKKRMTLRNNDFIFIRIQIQNLVMQNFLEAVEVGYSKFKNPYHNLVHATDVLQTLYSILNNAGLMVLTCHSFI